MTSDPKDPAYYRWDNIEKRLAPEELGRFKHWMRGQTCALDDDGVARVYRHDWERWVSQGMKDEQGNDWD